MTFLDNMKYAFVFVFRVIVSQSANGLYRLSYFLAARAETDITNTSDIQSIQAVMFMAAILLHIGNISSSVSYARAALNSCLLLGLHCAPSPDISDSSRKVRNRLFWGVYKYNLQLGALLNLPSPLGDEDIGQDLPATIEPTTLTPNLLEGPTVQFMLTRMTNLHLDLVQIMAKASSLAVSGHTFPQSKPDMHTLYHSKISRTREIELDLHNWRTALIKEQVPLRTSNAVIDRYVHPGHERRVSDIEY